MELRQQATEATERVILGHSYVNIRGFRLRGDRPRDFPFRQRLSEPYQNRDLMGRAVEKDVPFDPDQAAFELIKQVYNAFGRWEGDIPFFDGEGHFDPDAGPKSRRD